MQKKSRGKSSGITVNLVPKMTELFQGEYSVRAAYGGRGSGKTRGFVAMMCVKAVFLAAGGISGTFICARQFHVAIQKSTLAEIKAFLNEKPDLAQYFDIGEKYLRTTGLSGKIEFDFIGLDKNLESMKSKSRTLVTFIDEAETVKEEALKFLLPTVLRDKAVFPDGTIIHPEVWIAWNPMSSDSAVYKRYVVEINSRPKAKSIKINHSDNPYFKYSGLYDLMLEDRNILDPATFAWIWEGELLTNSDAQILGGKVAIKDFTPDEARWDCYQGVDWGFSQDPTAAVRCWINPREPDLLYVSDECSQVKLDLDETGQFFKDNIKGFSEVITYADSARPESISQVNKDVDGCLRAVSKTTIEDGIAFLRSFRRICIHPRCQETLRETRLWTYKLRADGEITNKPIDKYNHHIDALRYALTQYQRTIAGSEGDTGVALSSANARGRRSRRRLM